MIPDFLQNPRNKPNAGPRPTGLDAAPALDGKSGTSDFTQSLLDQTPSQAAGRTPALADRPASTAASAGAPATAESETTPFGIDAGRQTSPPKRTPPDAARDDRPAVGTTDKTPLARDAASTEPESGLDPTESAQQNESAQRSVTTQSEPASNDNETSRGASGRNADSTDSSGSTTQNVSAEQSNSTVTPTQSEVQQIGDSTQPDAADVAPQSSRDQDVNPATIAEGFSTQLQSTSSTETGLQLVVENSASVSEPEAASVDGNDETVTSSIDPQQASQNDGSSPLVLASLVSIAVAESGVLTRQQVGAVQRAPAASNAGTPTLNSQTSSQPQAVSGTPTDASSATGESSAPDSSIQNPVLPSLAAAKAGAVLPRPRGQSQPQRRVEQAEATGNSNEVSRPEAASLQLTVELPAGQPQQRTGTTDVATVQNATTGSNSDTSTDVTRIDGATVAANATESADTKVRATAEAAAQVAESTEQAMARQTAVTAESHDRQPSNPAGQPRSISANGQTQSAEQTQKSPAVSVTASPSGLASSQPPVTATAVEQHSARTADTSSDGSLSSADSGLTSGQRIGRSSANSSINQPAPERRAASEQSVRRAAADRNLVQSTDASRGGASPPGAVVDNLPNAATSDSAAADRLTQVGKDSAPRRETSAAHGTSGTQIPDASATPTPNPLSAATAVAAGSANGSSPNVAPGVLAAADRNAILSAASATDAAGAVDASGAVASITSPQSPDAGSDPSSGVLPTGATNSIANGSTDAASTIPFSGPNGQNGNPASDRFLSPNVQRALTAIHSAASGENRLRVQLSPRELGSLMVDIVQTPHGIVARLEVTSSAAQQLLVDSLSTLHQSLSRNQSPVDRIDVVLNEVRTDSSRQQREQNQERGQNEQQRGNADSRQRRQRDDRQPTQQDEDDEGRGPRAEAA
ncbi:hypothetical protein GC176_11305 [bacterium]|nr:hypothetical protein [bacterium]